MEDKLYTLLYPWLNSKDTHTTTCCICSGINEQKTKSTFLLNGDLFEIRLCVGDNIMYLYPQPGDIYCEQLYNHPSYFDGSDDMYGLDLSNAAKSVDIAKIRIQEIKKYAPSSSSLLEVGSGYGFLLREAGDQGFNVAKGIELSKEASDVARKSGLDVECIDVYSDRFRYSPEVYDVVASYSNLEHLRNPVSFLEVVKNKIKSGGILVIRVPETDPKEGPRLSLLDHFWHFTRDGLRKVFLDSGFSILDIFESGTFRGIQHGSEMKSMTFILTK